MAPLYECTLIVKGSLAKSEVQNALMRVGKFIMKQGGVIRQLENYGLRTLPKKVNGELSGSYFCYQFDANSGAIPDLDKELAFDVDIIRTSVSNLDKDREELSNKPACTLHEEIKPPAYRLDILNNFKPMKGRGPPPFYFNEP